MSQLDLYHAKRDFSRTPEPRGKPAARGKKALRFLIQRHDATRLHYDFRLELDGVYKSWAVTKVPSLDPATKRLAVEVEDHPLEYGTFEGTIPQGQYGGGIVQLWDRGSWMPQSNNPQKDIEDGHLKLVLNGERLKGGWALVRMRDGKLPPGAKVRHNWLLIKERDENARPGKPDTLARDLTSVTTGRTLEEIAGAKRGRVWQSNKSVAENVKPKSSATPAEKKKSHEARQ